MTREEAIEVIKEYRDNLIISPSNQLDGDVKAFDMAIQALEQNESAEEWYKLFVEKLDEQQPCDDVVSRDAVLGAICDYVALEEYEDKSHTFTIRPLTKRIKELPSVTQKSGKWIAQQEANGDDYFKAYDISGVMTYAAKYKCDKCGFIQICIEDHGQYTFCPNCGADMRGAE